MVPGQVAPLPRVSVPAVCAATVGGMSQVPGRRGRGTWPGAPYPWGLCSRSVCNQVEETGAR